MTLQPILWTFQNPPPPPHLLLFFLKNFKILTNIQTPKKKKNIYIFIEFVEMIFFKNIGKFKKKII